MHYWTSTANRRIRAVDEGSFTTKFQRSSLGGDRDHVDDDLLDSVDNPAADEVASSSRPRSPRASVARPRDHVAIELDRESDFSSDGDEWELPEIDFSGNSAGPSSSARAHPATSTGTTRTAAAAAGPSQDELKTKVDDLALAVAAAKRDTESRLAKLESEHRLLLNPVKARRSAVGRLLSVWRCPLCANIPHPDQLLVAQCCKQVAGCQDCVQHWFQESEPHTCPNCRAENPVVEAMANMPTPLVAAIEEMRANDGDFTCF